MCVFQGVCLTAAINSAYEKDHEYRLAQKLIENYKARTEVRPVDKVEDPVIVTFDLAYSQLVDLVSAQVFPLWSIHVDICLKRNLGCYYYQRQKLSLILSKVGTLLPNVRVLFCTVVYDRYQVSSVQVIALNLGRIFFFLSFYKGWLHVCTHVQACIRTYIHTNTNKQTTQNMYMPAYISTYILIYICIYIIKIK